MADKLHEDILIENIKKNGHDENEIEDAIEGWQYTKSLIPSDFDTVVASEKCLFCKSEQPNEKECYADIMIAHKEPITKKASILSLGKKNKIAAIGSILPLNLAICKTCKRKFIIANSLKISIMILFAVIIIVAMSIVNIDSDFSDQGYLIFWGLIILLCFVGYIIGNVVSRMYIKKNTKDVKFNLFEIDLFERMKQKGWFLLGDEKLVTSFGFTKEKNQFGRIFKENEQDLD